MKKLTVVQLLPALNSGGVEKGTLEVAKALVEAGHRSIVISAGGQLVEILEQQGSEHLEWDLGKKSPLTFLKAKKLRQWLHSEGVDILHARSRMPVWVAYLAWKKMPENARPRFITTVHGMNSVSRYSKIMTAGERVIAVSDTVKKYVMQHYPDVDEKKITVIHRGIDPEEFPFAYQPSDDWMNQWYKTFPETRGKWLITLPGRLTRLKGHDDFIQIIQALKQQTPNVHGLIVGAEDPKRKQYAEGLYKSIRDTDLAGVITCTGYRKDMKEVYAISNVILSLSSKPESFGRTAVEGVSLGKPVVAYDHGGVGETLKALYPSGLVPLNQPDVVAERCLGVYHSQISPPTSPLSQYFKNDMLGKTLALYEELGDEKHP